MTENYEKFHQALKEDWYTQGFSAVPIFLNHAAWSGIIMKEKLGFGYTEYIFHYKNNYGELSYLHDDIDNIWQQVKNKLLKDPRYLEKIKKEYLAIFNQASEIFIEIDKQILEKVSDNILITYLQNCGQALTSSVGIAHIIDAIGLKIEDEFKDNLKQVINNQVKNEIEFNHYYSTLTTPSSLSFIAEEENNLRDIAKLSDEQRKIKLARHVNRYFWVQNSYAGAKQLTIIDFTRQLQKINKYKETKTINISVKKKNIINKFQLSQKLQDKIEVIDFTSLWQDQRKAMILKSIGYMGKVLNQLALRSGVKVEYLYYLGIKDVEKLKSISDIKVLVTELKLRKQGSWFLFEAETKTESVLTGEEYLSLNKKKEAVAARIFEEDNGIHGSIANMGTAIGRVVVCKSINSINKVKTGDILVTSMTRPEFMPALKKVAGIITDEGGITCHAAIISRELNIPAIIGTKIGTKVLKNGMIVAVKANHGYVKILKK